MINNSWKEMNAINSKLDNLSNKKAEAIGQAFSAALEDRMVSEAGVDMWIQQYPALLELSKHSEFFLSMAITIGKRKLMQALWGLAVKVGIGAFLSLLNVGTDISAVFNFKSRGEMFYANATLGMISLSVIIQLFGVFASNKKRGANIVLKEFLIVLSFFRPVVLVFRIVSGQKANDDALIIPMVELSSARIVEMYER